MSHISRLPNCIITRAIGSVIFSAVLGSTLAFAEPLALADQHSGQGSIFDRVIHDQATTDDGQDLIVTPARLRRQIVNFQSREPAGTIVVDTPNTYLYLVVGGGRAIRYGIGVGREGFTWSGSQGDRP